MQDSSAAHIARANEIADSLRKYLIGFNTGGIAAILAAAASLASECVNPKWVVPSFAFFSLGLCLVLISLFLQKHKALARRDAAVAGQPQPDYTKGIWRNFTWDLMAFSAFLIGVMFALSSLYSLVPECQVWGMHG